MLQRVWLKAPAPFYFAFYIFDIRGTNNPVADALSRIEINALGQGQDIKQWRKHS